MHIAQKVREKGEDGGGRGGEQSEEAREGGGGVAEKENYKERDLDFDVWSNVKGHLRTGGERERERERSICDMGVGGRGGEEAGVRRERDSKENPEEKDMWWLCWGEVGGGEGVNTAETSPSRKPRGQHDTGVTPRMYKEVDVIVPVGA